MIRFLIVLMFIPSSLFAGTKLKAVQVKPGEIPKIDAASVCYDEESLKKIDDAQKRGLDCQIKLKKAENRIEALETDLLVKVEDLEDKKFTDKLLFKLGLGVLLFSIGVGVGVNL